MQYENIPENYVARESQGFTAHIGPLFRRDTEDGRHIFGLRLAKHHMNLGAVAHGGLLTAFADNSLGEIVHRNAAVPCTTISLTVSFVAPGRVGDWIECTGNITRITSTLVFISGQIWCGEQTLLVAQGIWKLLGRR